MVRQQRQRQLQGPQHGGMEPPELYDVLTRIYPLPPVSANPGVKILSDKAPNTLPMVIEAAVTAVQEELAKAPLRMGVKYGVAWETSTSTITVTATTTEPPETQTILLLPFSGMPTTSDGISLARATLLAQYVVSIICLAITDHADRIKNGGDLIFKDKQNIEVELIQKAFTLLQTNIYDEARSPARWIVGDSTFGDVSITYDNGKPTITKTGPPPITKQFISIYKFSDKVLQVVYAQCLFFVAASVAVAENNKDARDILDKFEEIINSVVAPGADADAAAAVPGAGNAAAEAKAAAEAAAAAAAEAAAGTAEAAGTRPVSQTLNDVGTMTAPPDPDITYNDVINYVTRVYNDYYTPVTHVTRAILNDTMKLKVVREFEHYNDLMYKQTGGKADLQNFIVNKPFEDTEFNSAKLAGITDDMFEAIMYSNKATTTPLSNIIHDGWALARMYTIALDTTPGTYKFVPFVEKGDGDPVVLTNEIFDGWKHKDDEYPDSKLIKIPIADTDTYTTVPCKRLRQFVEFDKLPQIEQQLDENPQLVLEAFIFTNKEMFMYPSPPSGGSALARDLRRLAADASRRAGDALTSSSHRAALRAAASARSLESMTRGQLERLRDVFSVLGRQGRRTRAS